MHRWLVTGFEEVKKVSSYFAVFEHVQKKNSSYFADFEQVRMLVVILLTLNESKNFCNELLQKLYHSLQGSVAERIKCVSCIILAYHEKSSNLAGSKHFLKVNVL